MESVDSANVSRSGIFFETSFFACVLSFFPAFSIVSTDCFLQVNLTEFKINFFATKKEKSISEKNSFMRKFIVQL